MRIGSPTTAQTAESIEHAWTHETHERDHTQLEPRRRIPGRAPAPCPPRLVHPSWGTLEITNRLVDGMSRHGAFVGSRTSVSRSFSHDEPDGDLGQGEATYGLETDRSLGRRFLGEDDLFIND
jgi:hypothetical protein